MTRSIAEFYKNEVKEAVTTEHILGESKSMAPIALDAKAAKNYVGVRIGFDKRHSEQYYGENALFRKFWPNGSIGEQIIYIEGEPGLGKSTFLAHFFRFFLPNKPFLSLVPPTTKASEVHSRSCKRHIVLYADLKHCDVSSFRSNLFRLLGESLEDVAKWHELLHIDASGEKSEAWFTNTCMNLARQRNGEDRAWYISWLIDNVDQLDPRYQRDLLTILTDYVTQELRTEEYERMSVETARDILWRVIIPVRPETQYNFNLHTGAVANITTLRLDPVHPDKVIAARAEGLKRHVIANEREFQEDFQASPACRPCWNGETVDEIADMLASNLVAGHSLDSNLNETTGEARALFDELVDNSTRRRLTMATKAALSRSFRERLRLATEQQWEGAKVSTFYFLDGLLRGDEDVFNPGESDILNLYDLGASSGSPYSVFVGLHAMFLLNQKQPWSEIKKMLAGIGYDQCDLMACEEKLRAKHVIKSLWDRDGSHRSELSLVDGHWRLLKERAYTDNMAIACARQWDFADKVPFTDPLEPRDILKRLQASLCFMQKIAVLEQAVTAHSPTLDARGISRHIRRDQLRELQLPSITSYIAKEYLARARKFPSYVKPHEAMEPAWEAWEHWWKEMEALIAGADLAHHKTYAPVRLRR